VEAGRVARTWIGRAVIVASVIPCDTCDACRRGRPAICPNQKMPGNDVHGGFATHVVVPVHGLCPVDEARLARIGLGLAEVAVLADAVTTPFQAVTRAGVGPGDLAIVVGVGGVGSHAVQIAAARGATVVAIDVDPDKLAKVARYGAALTLDARAGDARGLKRAIAEFAARNGLRGTEWSIFECSGSAPGQLTAYELLVPGSTLSVVGFTRAKIEVRLSNLMAFDARAIGTWGCPPGLYPDALELVLEGKVQLRPFVEMRPLSSINAVFAEAHAGALSRRVVLVPDS
jgi:6-hydroxycyclohex-1-ene-1-carbonyl-CoA dehydrogenase